MVLKRKVVGDNIYLMDGENTILSIKEINEDDGLKVIFSGNLRSETVHNFWDELSALVSFGMNLVLDFKEVSHVSSSAVDALVKLQQAIDSSGKGGMKIISVPSTIFAEWEKDGVTQVLMVEEG